MTSEATRSADVAGAVALSTAAQLVAKVLHLALNVVASLALIRALGPSGYGDYVFVLSIAALFGLISDLGLAKIAVRESSRDEASAGTILGTAIVARLLLAAVAAVLAQLALVVLDARGEIRLAVGVVSLLYVTDAFLSLVVVFQLRLAMQYEALVTVVVQAIDTVLILLLVAAHADLVALVAAPVASGAVGCVLALAIARGRFGARLRLDLSRLPYLVWESAPIGITLLIAVAYLKLDSVLLGIISSPTEVGLYGSAFRPIEYLLLAAAVLITPMFPLLSRWYGREQRRFATAYWRTTDALLAVYLPVPVLLVFVARPLVTGVFTEPFAPAALPMQILAIALVCMSVSAWQSFALLAGGRQRLTVVYDAIGLAVNVALNLLLIPRLGAVGAALASLVTAVFIVACSTAVTRRVLDLSGASTRLARILAANIALGIVLAILAPLVPWWALVGVSPLPYALALLVFRVTTIAELRVFVPSRAPAPALAEVRP